MAHRRFRSGISQSQRRKKVWAAFQTLANADGQLSTELTLILNFDATPLTVGAVSSAAIGYVFGQDSIDKESTLMRTRGALQMQKNEVDNAAGGDQTVFAFGIGVMETGAATLGAFPNPASPAGAVWDGWMFYRSQNQGAVDANAGIVDVKSMRKIQSGYSLIMVMGVHTVSNDGSPPANVPMDGFFTGRGLFLLP